MDREQAIQAIREHWKDLTDAGLLEWDSKRKNIVCPMCPDSGMHTKGGRAGLGALEPIPRTPGTFKCFSCDWMGDVLDVIKAVQGVNFNDALEMAANVLNLSVDRMGYGMRRVTAFDDFGPYPIDDPAPAAQGEPAAPSTPDYSNFISQAQKRLTDPAAVSYLQSRGISLETAQAAGVGYDPAWRHPNVSQNVPSSPRLIFPSGTAYTARDIRPDAEIPKAAKPYVKSKTRGAFLFGADALESDGPLFVTEGEIDALSVMEAGAQALAIGSANNAIRFLGFLENRVQAEKHVPQLILALDNDKAGKKAAATIADGLLRLGLSFSLVPDELYSGAKDPNDALQKSRETFTAAVLQADTPFDTEAAQLEAAKRADVKERLQHALQNGPAFLQRVKNGNNERLPTGFTPVDRLLGGGLYPGLIAIGARTGMGKTSLCLQFADHIAKSGRPVLYAALEMDRDELAAKSIARIHSAVRPNAVSFAQILEGVAPPDVELSAKSYFSWAEKYMYVLDTADGAGRVSDIARLAHDIADETGTAPVVFVDYLQLLSSDDVKQSDRQMIAKSNVLALKRISKQLHTPVVVITSLNRASYGGSQQSGGKPGKDGKPREKTDDEWFEIFESGSKESGDIEHTVDILFGMRPTAYHTVNDDGGPGMDMRLYLVKNRRGAGHLWEDITFHSARGTFTLSDITFCFGETPFDKSGSKRKQDCFEV